MELTITAHSLKLDGCAVWWNGVFAGHIATRDQDFVGEDPVLTRELTRRLARNSPPAEILRLPTGADKNESFPPPAGDSLDGLLSGFRRHNFYWDLSNQEETNQKKGHGDEPKYIAYKKDYNATNLYAMHLKVAEHAIYGVQQRLEKVERIMAPYKENTFMRMAFILRRLDVWQREMVDFYDYSHRNYRSHYSSSDRWWAIPMSGNNPWWFPVIRHIMYYQVILRRYIDIIYSLEFLRKIHREEMEKALQNAEELQPEKEKSLAASAPNPNAFPGAAPPPNPENFQP